MRLAEMFRRKKLAGEKAFVAYLTAGDPSLAATGKFLASLEKAGADIVELGVPFSDPVADGPTNQKAAMRALKSGTNLKGILQLVKSARADGVRIPIVIFTYFNPLLRMGIETFADEAASSGVDGVLVVDLPPEEGGELRSVLRKRGIDSILLASPTTDPERLKRIGEMASGFLYYVSRTGVTGTSEALSSSLSEGIRRVREAGVTVPVCIGFGISTPEQVAAAVVLCEGVIVGSALVKLIEESATAEIAERRLSEEVSRLVAPLKKEKIPC